MTQEEFDNPKLDEKSIPGPRLVAWLVGSMVFFPLACALLLIYARRVGHTEGVQLGYSAMRDPKAWLFIVAVLVGSGVLAKWLGRSAKKVK